MTSVDALLTAIVDERVRIALDQREDELRPTWLNEKDAAAYLALKSQKTLANARRDGKVVGQKHGGSYIYERVELDRFGREG